MPTMIVRQPDAKLAAFSSVVDDFTAWDMTEEEAFDFCREELELRRTPAREEVRAGVEDHVPYKNRVKGSGIDRWVNALRTIAAVHGMARLCESVAEIGLPDQDLSSYEVHARKVGDVAAPD